MILEQAPESAEQPADRPAAATGGVVPWLLSGRTEPALRAQAERLGAFLTRDGAEGDATDVGWSLATTRSAFEHRAVLLGDDRSGLLAGLAGLAADEPGPAVVRGTAVGANSGPVLVFPGQGSQWVGMGVGLLDSSPVFAERIAECEKALAPYVDWSLTDVLRGAPDAADIERVDVVQPVLWAVMVSLAAVWAAYGVRPAAVVGHSQGEIAAACVAGALSLDDGARVVALRSKALRVLSGLGAMASLGCGPERAEQLAAEHAPGVAVAAMNGPSSTVVSGPADEVAKAVAAAEAAGLRARTIDVDYASHGPQVDRIEDELAAVLAGVSAVDTGVGFYSTVTGARMDGAALDAGYWFTNLRRPVRFAQAMEALIADGYRVFVEASAHPVLTVGMQECIEAAGATAVTVGTLRRNEGGPERLCRALAEAYVAGVAVDWTAWFPSDPAPRTVPLPVYAFQRERYWLPTEGPGSIGDLAGVGLTPVGHALLPAAVGLADGGLVLTGRLPDTGRGGWLGEHVVAGLTLLPGVVLVEWVLRAADEAGCAGVEELALQVPVVLPSTGGLRVQVVVGAAGDDGRRTVQVHSRPEGDDGAVDGWVCHVTGVLRPGPAGPAPQGLTGPWPPAGAQPVGVEGFYERAEAAGYGYGPAFRGLRNVWRHGADTLAEVVLPAEAAGQADRFGIHPVLLDAAMQPVLLGGQLDAAPDADPAGDTMLLPFTWSGVSLWAGGATRVRVRLSPQPDGLQVTVADATGAPVLSADAVVLRETSTRQLRMTGGGRGTHGLLALDWTPLPETADSAVGAGGWAVLGDDVPQPAGAARHADLDALFAALDGGGPVPQVVVASVATAAADDGLATAGRVLALAQRWLARPELADARLVLLTRDAVQAGDDADRAPVDTAAAAVWGLVRSAQSENPGRFVLVDLADADRAAASDAGLELADAVARAVGADEPQVALRAGAVLVPRLVRADADQELAAPPGESAWRVEAGGTSVDDLAVVSASRAAGPLAPGQVRIAVRAAGVNFRDVLIALGMYPDDTATVGIEGAGVVAEVAGDVTGVAVGDRVMGLFDEAFGPLAVADARMVAPVPAGWDFRQAAAAPVAFLTAWYGLVDLARAAVRRERAAPRGDRRRGHGGRPGRPPPGCAGLRDGEPRQAPDAGADGRGRGAPRVVARPGLRGRVPHRHRRPRGRRGPQQPGRRVHRRVAAAAGGRRPAGGDGQDGPARPGRGRRASTAWPTGPTTWSRTPARSASGGCWPSSASCSTRAC